MIMGLMDERFVHEPYRCFRRSPRALPVIVEAIVPYRLLQEPSCPTGYRRSHRALPDIVVAFVPYWTLQELSCPTKHRRSLCALPDIVDAYELVTPQIRDVSGQRQTYTYASEALTYQLLFKNPAFTSPHLGRLPTCKQHNTQTVIHYTTSTQLIQSITFL